MAEQKYITYVVEVDTSTGQIKIDGLTKGFVDADIAVKKLNKSLLEQNKQLQQGASAAGLAGAAVTELGRTISDMNYGMTAVANNLQQLSALLVILVSRTGSWKNALGLLWTTLKGPLGLIVAFQTIIFLMEKFSMESKKATDSVGDLAKAAATAATELEILLQKRKDSGAITPEEEDGFKKRIAFLKAEATIKQQIEQIDTLKKAIVDAEQKSVEEFVPWYEQTWIALSRFVQGNSLVMSPETLKRMSRIGGPEKQQVIDGLTEEIKSIYEAIDANVLEAMNAGKSGGDKKSGSDKFKPSSYLFGGLADNLIQQVDPVTQAYAKMGQAQAGFFAASFRNTAEEVENQRQATLDLETQAEARIAMFSAIGEGMQSMGIIMGRETAIGKGIAAAGALIDTYASITKTLRAFADKPIPGYAIAQAVATGLFGFAQVRKILEVRTPSRGGGGGSVGSPNLPAPQQPSFNIVGGTQGNQIRDTIQEALGKPIRAYVTTRDIRSGEELDRNIVRGATVG